MEAYEAKVNVTFKGQNGDLPDPVNFEAPDISIRGWVGEALRTGNIPGIDLDRNADVNDFVVDRFGASETIPYNRLMLRPKTPFGFEG